MAPPLGLVRTELTWQANGLLVISIGLPLKNAGDVKDKNAFQ